MADGRLLRAQRGLIKSALTRIETFCQQENSPLDQVKARAERADQLLREYEDIQFAIDQETPEEQLGLEERYRMEIESKYFNIKAKVHALQGVGVEQQQQHPPQSIQGNGEITTAINALVQHQSSMGALMERFANNVQTENASTPVLNTTQNQSELRLPRVHLPEFDGNILEWTRFKELFESFVHTRTNLSNIEKLEYLSTKVRGDALSLIKHLKPTTNNYEVAWQLLNKKYDNKEVIKSAYMKLLFERPDMKSGGLSELKQFYNGLNEGYNALKSLDETVEQWSAALLFNVEKKLDMSNASLWFREKKIGETSTFPKFLEFLEKRLFEMESIQAQHPHNANTKESNKRPQMRTYTTTNQVCPACSSNHFLYQCEKFAKMSVSQRRDLVQKSNLCFNCLRNNHKANECNSRTCKKCDKKHNTLLHMKPNSYSSQHNSQQTAVGMQQGDSQHTTTTNEISDEVTHMSANISQRHEQTHVILPTAIISILGINNVELKCRALLDSGSQGTLISESCVQRLGLKRKHDKTVVYGLGNKNGNHSKGKVDLVIAGSDQVKRIETEALCLTSLTRIFPSINIHNTKLNYFRNLKLADTKFYEAAEIDVILGADVYLQCCLSEVMIHPSGSPAALNTIFGWVIMGKVPSENNNPIYSNHVTLDVEKCLQRFWEIEEMPQKQQYTLEEEAAENYYEKTTQRLKNGRYEVRLPFKNNTVNIGESKAVALKRLESMERKFDTNEQLGEDYKAFMKEYTELGHMQLVDEECRQHKYYLPHHAIMKPSSTTSKIRVVFDASSKSSNSLSLNDNLLVGPKVQKDLFDILISFRMNKIAYVGDIEKMYRQVLMNKDDRFLQCVLWRENKNDDVKQYTLNTVTYGTAAASFLATRTLIQVANDNSSLSCNTLKALRENFYVDDFMHSSEDVQQAVKLKDELCSALSQSGFHLRKWSSNSEAFLNTIAPQDRATSLDTEIQQTSTVTTLGLIWNTKGDFFKYSSLPQNSPRNITKRSVLSSIAKIYDPMGWVAPTVIQMKIYMQKLWLKGVNWDEPLPPELINEWNKICTNIEALQDIKIHRWIQYHPGCVLELHGFSDASELAYAAAVYAKVRCSSKTFTYLIAAKTRVAPVKQVSLPRLELCAAHLLVKLMSKIRDSIGIANIAMYGWTDSTIVLAWISDHPRRWKTFIANRTAEIINIMPAQQWRHIKSQSNSADLATRGISTKELANNTLWWHGPNELQQENFESRIPEQIIKGVELEEKSKVTSSAVSLQQCGYIESFSNYNKLIRMTALVLRFAYNCKNKQQKQTGYITTNELRNAHDTVVKVTQRSFYAAEIKLLLSNGQLSSHHPLSSVSPIIDKAGVLRVGGRLKNADIKYEQKHPIVLHKNMHLTKLIIRHYHTMYLHAGNRLLQCIVQLKYWIPAVSSVIKATIYKCSICMRQRAIPYQQQMGELPKYRVVPAPVFSKVGIDYAGPCQVRAWSGRGTKTYKTWIAIFVCMVTKAIHIELVSELSTAAFISSLRRFIARRGKPLHIYTDNGTNFVGANNHLISLYEFLQNSANQDCIQKYLADQQINWHFIPPGSPNFGGLWEAGVKAIKYHLKRILKEAHPTFEEMYTILCQIEGCLNSRPLCIKFEGDIDPLTPAHFTILRPMNSLPDENMDGVKENRLTRWQYIQRLVNDFWKKWSVEYLHQMQQRNKWKQTRQNLAINDVVVIKEENTAPTQWLMGRVSEVHPGADGLIRVVTLKTKNGYLKRPVSKICPLFQES